LVVEDDAPCRYIESDFKWARNTAKEVEDVVSAFDVAAYVQLKRGPMTTWKLQKLLYYSQAWHLVWDEQPLFPERIEAWANGPVVVDVYRKHKGRFTLDLRDLNGEGDPEKLDASERGTVDAVLRNYGDLDGRKLSHLTHAEDPWRRARGDLPPTATSSNEITPESMQAYYLAVDTAPGATPVDKLDWREWESMA